MLISINQHQFSSASTSYKERSEKKENIQIEKRKIYELCTFDIAATY